MTTMIITPADIQRIIHKPESSFFNVDGTTVAPYGPGIRGSNWPSSTNPNQHLPQATNLLSFNVDVENTAVVIRTLRFRQAAVDATNKIAYLPYFENKITSMIIPINDSNISCFTTPSLSGCRFFIDRLLNGNLVCYHDNALQAANLTATRAYQPYQGWSNLASVSKERYYRETTARELEKRRETGVTYAEFFGGTTVMGFRETSGQWVFRFQTYGVIRYKYLDKNKKEVRVGFDGEVPEQIFQCEQLWP